MANVLKRYGVRRGDVVVIYMPMIPQAAYAMLACARIGGTFPISPMSDSVACMHIHMHNAQLRTL